jgi:hypothetical protein
VLIRKGLNEQPTCRRGQRLFDNPELVKLGAAPMSELHNERVMGSAAAEVSSNLLLSVRRRRPLNAKTADDIVRGISQ